MDQGRGCVGFFWASGEGTLARQRTWLPSLWTMMAAGLTSMSHPPLSGLLSWVWTAYPQDERATALLSLPCAPLAIACSNCPLGCPVDSEKD
jgi:hypothetical protein